MLRILVPCLLGYYLGYVPAIIFHDYLGTVLTLIWLGALWHLSFRSLLTKANPSQVGAQSGPMEGTSRKERAPDKRLSDGLGTG